MLAPVASTPKSNATLGLEPSSACEPCPSHVDHWLGPAQTEGLHFSTVQGSSSQRQPHNPSPHACSSLPGAGLNSTLPADGWGALGSLAELDLRNNSIHGQLAAAFPNSLQHLFLSGNSLTSISPPWQPPPHLRSLSLTNNSLNQTLTEQQGWLAAAGELEELYLRGSGLHGTLPVELALPPRLTALLLDGNQLTGAPAYIQVGWTN